MKYEEIKKLLEKVGQVQLLDYYEELDDDGKARLLKEIERIDFSALDNLACGGERKIGRLSPADALSIADVAKRRDEFEKEGLKALKAGKIAAVLLAGGQGTRLGIDAPKGTFNIGINKELSIFACQMQTIKEVAARAGFNFRLFVMTSTVNDEATRKFFKDNNFFGYEEDKISFYVQETSPACSFDGKVFLEEKDKPFLSPNGNGGWYSSLVRSGLGSTIEKEGIEWLNVYAVDNVLQRICDPVFIGATLLSGKACSGKVVRKVDAEEKVGVMCKEDGLPAIVEYYEMPPEYKTMTDDKGELVYCYGVILNYLFSVKGLDGVYKRKLPYHLAKKAVPHIENGVKVTPKEPNGYKFETLAVDLIKLMGSCLAVEVEREKEFAPVKNRTGVDSVDTARELLAKNGVEL